MLIAGLIDGANSGASPAQRAAEAKPHTYRNRKKHQKTTHRNYETQAFLFFIVNMVSGIARGRDLFPTTTTAASHKHGGLSHIDS